MRNLVRSAGFGALSTGFSPTGVDSPTEDRRTAGPRLARSCLSHHSPLCPEAKSRRLIPESRIIGTAQGQGMVIIGDYRQLGGREGGIIIHGDLAATTGETRV